MGHKGDIEHTYTLNKWRLPPGLIEDARSAYKRSQEFLQIDSLIPKEKEIESVLKKRLLKVSGFSEEEIEDFLFKNPSDEELKRAIKNTYS
jgi:hypothetical protein